MQNGHRQNIFPSEYGKLSKASGPAATAYAGNTRGSRAADRDRRPDGAACPPCHLPDGRGGVVPGRSSRASLLSSTACAGRLSRLLPHDRDCRSRIVGTLRCRRKRCDRGAGQDRVPRRVATPMARFAGMASAKWRAFKWRIPINSTHGPKNLKMTAALQSHAGKSAELFAFARFAVGKGKMAKEMIVGG